MKLFESFLGGGHLPLQGIRRAWEGVAAHDEVEEVDGDAGSAAPDVWRAWSQNTQALKTPKAYTLNPKTLRLLDPKTPQNPETPETPKTPKTPTPRNPQSPQALKAPKPYPLPT